MSDWWKNGLLLAAGGIAGLTLAAWLESEEDDDKEETLRRKLQNTDGLELLVEKVRREAQWAMEECATVEEQEEVYEEVAASIRELQATLQSQGEEIIAELKGQGLDGEDSEGLPGRNIRRFKSSMEDLTKSLDETLAALKPAPAA